MVHSCTPYTASCQLQYVSRHRSLAIEFEPVSGGHRSTLKVLPMSRGKSVTYVLGTLGAITHNESHVCDVALSPTRAKGHVAERRAAAPRSPRRPLRAPMYIRAVMGSCAIVLTATYAQGSG